MSPATLDVPAGLFAAIRGDYPAARRRATLEERLDAVWRTVSSAGEAECPVCHATMRYEGGAGRCTGCGSRIS